MSKGKNDHEATPNRPKWIVDSDKGEIRRDTGPGAPIELIAKWDSQTGIVQIEEGKSNYRAAIVNVMKGENGGHFSSFGEIGKVQEVPKDAPPKPKKAFKHGEKTPQRVEWMAQYMKETFLAMWGVFKMQVRTGYQKVERIGVNEETGDRFKYTEDVPVYEDVPGFDYSIAKLKSGEQRLIAWAKTCLTHKAEESPDLSEYDHDLDAADADDDGI